MGALGQGQLLAAPYSVGRPSTWRKHGQAPGPCVKLSVSIADIGHSRGVMTYACWSVEAVGGFESCVLLPMECVCVCISRSLHGHQ